LGDLKVWNQVFLVKFWSFDIRGSSTATHFGRITLVVQNLVILQLAVVADTTWPRQNCRFHVEEEGEGVDKDKKGDH